MKKVNPQSMIHLTEKPVELAVRAMQYSSRAGENVIDLFGGSGSTLIAAEQTGRRAFLMELDPLYCDVIVERFEKFTGQKAERIRTRGRRDQRSPVTERPRTGKERNMDQDVNKGSLNPTSLPISDAAKLLTRVGGQSVTVEMLQADQAAGAPFNADGTINLVHYAAWLVREMLRRE